MSTTAYAWTYRPEEVRKQTLESFSKYDFNKIRMLVFPKYYRGGVNDVNVSYDPPVFPFEGSANNFDFQTPNPEYFRNFEDRGMKQEDDLLYVKYMLARLSAYRNAWWSLANEFDIDKTIDGKFCVSMVRKDWDLIS